MRLSLIFAALVVLAAMAGLACGQQTTYGSSSASTGGSAMITELDGQIIDTWTTPGSGPWSTPGQVGMGLPLTPGGVRIPGQVGTPGQVGMGLPYSPRGTANAWNNRGLMLARQGRYHEAISAFDKAISQDSNFAQAYSNKGAALFGAGYAANTARPGTGDVWYWAALESFDAAIRIDSSQPMPWFNAGFVLRFLGEYDLALECQNVALALDPGFSDARSERNYLLARKAGR